MKFTTAISSACALFSVAQAHYANIAMEGVNCYIYNGIKGTPQGHMIVQEHGRWYDHDDPSNKGTITVVHNTTEYDEIAHGVKIGIVCAPEYLNVNDIGIPYVEMEPSDKDFYQMDQTVFEYSTVPIDGKVQGIVVRPQFTCIIRFCRNSNALGEHEHEAHSLPRPEVQNVKQDILNLVSDLSKVFKRSL